MKTKTTWIPEAPINLEVGDIFTISDKIYPERSGTFEVVRVERFRLGFEYTYKKISDEAKSTKEG